MGSQVFLRAAGRRPRPPPNRSPASAGSVWKGQARERRKGDRRKPALQRTLRGRPSGTYFLFRQKVCKDRSKGFPLCEPPHGRFVSGRRAPPCQCILSTLFSKKWLFGRGSTHGCFRLGVLSVALLHVSFVRFCCGYVNLLPSNVTTAETNRQTLSQHGGINSLSVRPWDWAVGTIAFWRKADRGCTSGERTDGVQSTPRG